MNKIILVEGYEILWFPVQKWNDGTVVVQYQTSGPFYCRLTALEAESLKRNIVLDCIINYPDFILRALGYE